MVRVGGLLGWGLCATLAGCGSAPMIAGRAVQATAPAGVTEAQLGMPYDARFAPFVASGGESLFKGSVVPRRSPLNQMQHEYVVVDSQELLAANLSGWGVLAAEAGMGSDRKHASYRAMQIEYVVDVDDTAEMRTPPPGTAYYLSRIFYGHSYEMLLSGSSRDFHGGVRAQLLSFSGSVNTFAGQHRLTTKAVGRGMMPRNGQAIFARTPEEIQSAYVSSGPAVPIIVEFRRVPNTQVLDVPIPWPEPVRLELQLVQLRVTRDGTWGKTPWMLSIECSANGNPLALADQFVWEGYTTDGGVYPINKVLNLEVFPGEHVSCGVGGTYSGPIAGMQHLPIASMPAPIVVAPATNLTTTMVGADYSVAYQLDCRATAHP